MAYRLHGERDGRTLRLIIPDGTSTLGADSGCDLVLAVPTISRRHAEFDCRAGRLAVRDLGSSNGSRVDGEPIHGAVEIRPGQDLQFGEISLALEAVEGGDEEIAAALPGRAQEAAAADATLAPMALNRLAFEFLPGLLRAHADGVPASDFVRRVGEALWQALPLTRLSIRGGDRDAVLFEAGTHGGGEEIEGPVGDYRLGFESARPLAPGHGDAVLGLADALLALVKPEKGTAVPADRIADGLPDPPPLDPDVVQVYARARRAAASEINVLIRGESGTGKELLARFVHDQSRSTDKHSDRSFVAINCAALNSDLLEAELFGIEKGVATGVDARAGCFERAHGGTLFLDEIGDMPKATQAKILRVIQEGELVRVGGSRRIEARPRLVSATNRDLEALIASGDFRLDLLHRISGWEVTLPPLRDRPADLANLALHFLGRYCADHGVAVRGISRRALELMRAYHWPGNVRELEQEMHRVSVFLGDGDVLSGDDLAPAVRGAASTARTTGLADRLAAHERRMLKQAVAEHDGNVSRAAESLGIARSTMYRRMEQLGLDTGADP